MLSGTAYPDTSGKSRLSARLVSGESERAARAGISGNKLIFIATISTLIFSVACSTTSHVSLKENKKEQIKQKLNDYEQDDNVGAEVTLLFENRIEIKGELLSVRDITMVICTEHSATENELANRTYPINNVRNAEIQEIIIAGDSYVWTGIGYGALGGAVLLGIIVYATTPEDNNSKGGYLKDEGIFSKGGQTATGIILGALVGAIAGGVIGYTVFNDDVVLQEFPTGYDFSLLKPLARYPQEEPEYLRSIK